MPAPRKGEIIDGYEFLGGDPNDQRSWQEWGKGVRKLPDGSVVREGPKGGLTVLRKAGADEEGGGEPLREFEINAAARATLMDEGLREYERAKADGYDPSSLKNVVARSAEGVWGVGPMVADVIRDNPSERARAAELQFVDGALRTTSGANAPEPEVIRANRAYFRQPGESAGVEANKALLRDRFRTTSIKAAGRAYEPRKDAAATAGAKKPPVPAAARQQAAKLRAAGTITQKGTNFGTAQNPYVARNADVFNTLTNDPKMRGKYIIGPNGEYGVIE
jgi:hypothetical protein